MHYIAFINVHICIFIVIKTIYFFNFFIYTESISRYNLSISICLSLLILYIKLEQAIPNIPDAITLESPPRQFTFFYSFFNYIFYHRNIFKYVFFTNLTSCSCSPYLAKYYRHKIFIFY